ncbi:Kelch repeat-containing protein [candidate division CSSED10-310 bacterium]|uniref:Kelch repeat-containing protein n=1 Tax=candidate division CSSED10-310 bacterium TaxID=2855610 RepID=A0ABV6YUM0_UNCC1
MKSAIFIYIFACLLLCFIISCQTDTGNSEEKSIVVFKISLKDEAARDLNITTMRLRIYNHLTEVVWGPADYAWDLHGCLLAGVKPGRGYQLRAEALNAAGTVYLTGYSELFDALANQTTDVGNIVLMGVGDWAYTSSFTVPRAYHSSIVYKDYVYIIGGTDGFEVLDDIQYAQINPDGSIDSWNFTTSLSNPRSNQTSIVYNDYLYAMGGDRYQSLSWVEFARINENGTIGSFRLTSSFQEYRLAHTSVVYNGYLYVLGGLVNNNDECINDVLFTEIKSDGTLGQWRFTTSFNGERYGAGSAVYNGFVYIIGGHNLIHYHDDVQFTAINSDGTVGNWQFTSSLPIPVASRAAEVHKGYIFVTASQNSLIEYAKINPDGTINPWEVSATTFENGRLGQTSIIHNNFMYVMGGRTGENNETIFNDVQYAPVPE